MNESTVLHHFNEIDLHFTSFLRGQSGLQYDATPTHSDPTIVISKQTSFMGTSLDEYTITSVYIVPTIHASNRIPQASRSGLELIMEHSASGSAANSSPESKKRLFLCAIISSDDALEESSTEVPEQSNANLVGSDAGFIDFVQSIDTSPSTPAQFRINNSRILPVSVSMTFPGITECLVYSDVDSNRVLLLTNPLLLPESVISAISSQISENSAPVFGNFDLIPASTSVERMKFLSNRVNNNSMSISTGTGINDIKTDFLEQSDANEAVVDRFTGSIRRKESMTTRRTVGASANESANASANESRNALANESRNASKIRGSCPSRNTSPSDDAIFALNSMALALVLIPLCVLCWLYYPWLYSKQVIQLSSNPDKIQAGVWWGRCIAIVYLVATIIMISVSSAYRNWLAMIIGLSFVVLWITAIVAVQFDVNSPQSTIKSELSNNENINKILWDHHNYDTITI